MVRYPICRTRQAPVSVIGSATSEASGLESYTPTNFPSATTAHLPNDSDSSLSVSSHSSPIAIPGCGGYVAALLIHRHCVSCQTLPDICHPQSVHTEYYQLHTSRQFFQRKHRAVSQIPTHSPSRHATICAWRTELMTDIHKPEIINSDFRVHENFSPKLNSGKHWRVQVKSAPARSQSPPVTVTSTAQFNYKSGYMKCLQYAPRTRRNLYQVSRRCL